MRLESLPFLVLSLAAATSVVAQNDTNPVGNVRYDPVADIFSKVLTREINLRDLLRHTNAFQEHAKLTNATSPNRAFGTPGNKASVDYVVSALKKTRAYDVRLQEFKFPRTVSLGQPQLAIDGSPISQTFYIRNTPPIPGDGISGDLVYIPPAVLPNGNVASGCRPQDFADVDVTGKIALIIRGECALTDKTRNAREAGAIGTILYLQSNEGPASTWPRLDPYNEIPSVGITHNDALTLVSQLNSGSKLVANIKYNVTWDVLTTYNIIADSKRGDRNNVVHIGSHLDSVEAGPGINDNGSGSAAILETALKIAKYPIKNTLRFSWWGAEEVGLRGAEYYVKNLSETEKAKTALYLNFDMIASPNYVLGVYDGDGSASSAGPAGSDKIEYVFNNYFQRNRIPFVPSAFTGRSDYGPFIAVGIPSGGLATGAEGIKSEENAKKFGGKAGVAYDVCYHKACDTVDNLNHKALLTNAKAVAHAAIVFGWDVSFLSRDRAASFSFGEAQQDQENEDCGGGVLI
ncbi:hypothetical protein BC832DRAFT_225862 [Gaertneriomyces semiglobifer]|nr:hypothetical protein BC832DRAFT_225862 [Gaertneriomyces semiglobifer]